MAHLHGSELNIKMARVAYFGKDAKSRLVHSGKNGYLLLVKCKYQHDATENNFINYEYGDFGVSEKLFNWYLLH